MKIVVFVLISSLALSACLDKEENLQLNNIEYSGVFMRLRPGHDAVESPVTLILNHGTYTGVADSLYYPAICEGNYSIEGNRITFSNDCVWTANFDWSLILNGTYVIEENQSETILIQEVGDEYNVYRLE